jgi:hypothetical protein
MRNVGPSFRDDRCTECRQRVTAFADDVDDIHGHARAEGDDEHLNGRGAGGAIAVDDGGDPCAGDAECQLLRPDELGGDWRLGSHSTVIIVSLTLRLALGVTLSVSEGSGQAWHAISVRPFA